MSDATDQRLLEALLDSWDRNNTILVNLLRALPEGGLEVRAMEGSPSIVEMFTHIHYGRLVIVLEDAPEFAGSLPEEEWAAERDLDRIAQMLNASAKVVRDAVKNGVEAGRRARCLHVTETRGDAWQRLLGGANLAGGKISRHIDHVVDG